MRTSSRRLLLFVAATILPSCGPPRHPWVWITVHNDGAITADVESEIEYYIALQKTYDHASLSVAPGQAAVFGFEFSGLNRLSVVVRRSTDHLEIFDESWDNEDVRQLDNQISITVSP